MNAAGDVGVVADEAVAVHGELGGEVGAERAEAPAAPRASSVYSCRATCTVSSGSVTQATAIATGRPMTGSGSRRIGSVLVKGDG